MIKTTQSISGSQEMPVIKFIGSDDEERVFETPIGRTVMEVAVMNGLNGIDADCGGVCSCATCHVYIERDWWPKVGPPGDVEQDLLELASEVRETSRLSCQIVVTEELDGLTVRLPE